MRIPRVVQACFASCLVSVLGCTPEQGEAVPITQLFTDAKLHKKYATVTGVLGISGGFMGSTTCKSGRCKVELSVPDAGWKPPKDVRSTIEISVGVGSGENEMAALPDKYSRADLKVKAKGGKVLSAGDRVKVSGNLRCHGNNGEDVLPCKMDVERIDVP
ncbi:Hypothetical protein A7982_01918 [Minicystis rosea]|nr:Hypothetical protein A7982_01918 [Minicystis rosea]